MRTQSVIRRQLVKIRRHHAVATTLQAQVRKRTAGECEGRIHSSPPHPAPPSPNSHSIFTLPLICCIRCPRDPFLREAPRSHKGASLVPDSGTPISVHEDAGGGKAGRIFLPRAAATTASQTGGPQTLILAYKFNRSNSLPTLPLSNPALPYDCALPYPTLPHL